MDMQSIYFPQGNDIVVQARYGPEVTDPTGLSAELYYKDNRYTPDTDPTTQVYESDVFEDPDNPGNYMSQFTVPDTDNANTGAFWYRVDVLDAEANRRTAGCGTLLVEAV